MLKAVDQPAKSFLFPIFLLKTRLFFVRFVFVFGRAGHCFVANDSGFDIGSIS